MRSLFISVMLITSSLAVGAEVGEQASYQVNRSRSRTSAIISGGSFKATLSEFLPSDSQNGPTYNVNYDYLLKIRFRDDQKGNGNLKLPESFFNGETLQELREKGQVKNSFFDARYLGKGSVTLADGRRFDDCDKIELTNINFNQSQALTALLKSMLSPALESSGHNVSSESIDDVQIVGYLHPDILVLGAVTVDITGVLSGFDFKIGFDHIASSPEAQ